MSYPSARGSNTCDTIIASAKPQRLGKKKERKGVKEEQETKALLCYPIAKTSTLTKGLDDTPCMKVVRSTLGMGKAIKMLAQCIEE